jgi:hypothetical protein
LAPKIHPSARIKNNRRKSKLSVGNELGEKRAVGMVLESPYQDGEKCPERRRARLGIETLLEVPNLRRSSLSLEET